MRILADPSGDKLAEFQGHGRILALRFSPDGRRLAYCSQDEFGVFNRASHTIESLQQQLPAWRAAISADGQLVARSTMLHTLAIYRNGTNVFSGDLPANRYGGN